MFRCFARRWLTFLVTLYLPLSMITGQHPADGVLTTPCCHWFRAYEVVSAGVFRFVPMPAAFDATKTYIYDIAWGPDYATGSGSGTLIGLTNAPTFNATVGCLVGYLGRTDNGVHRSIVLKPAATTNINDTFLMTSRNVTTTFTYNVVNANVQTLGTLQPEVNCLVAGDRRKPKYSYFGGGKFYPMGTYRVAYTSGALIYTPGDGYRLQNPSSTYAGTTWVDRGNIKDWVSLASSADGSKLVGAVQNDYLYTSVDYGVTWTQRASVKNWLRVASSADGTRLIACAASDYVYLSNDSGVTWSTTGAVRTWAAVAISGNGNHKLAVDGAGYIYYTNDTLGFWLPQDSVRAWAAVAISGNGDRFVAAANYGKIYYSNDLGTTWLPRGSDNFWSGVALSYDGYKVVACTNTDYIYTSVDEGITFTQRATAQFWGSIVSSWGGTNLAAVDSSGYIHISRDSGVTWAQTAISGAWNALATSADGSKLVAALYAGKVYTTTAGDKRGYSVISSISDVTGAKTIRPFNGLSDSYIYQAVCEAANNGFYSEFEHRGGPIGLLFEADYERAAATQRPVFTLSHQALLTNEDKVTPNPNTGVYSYFGYGKSYAAGTYKVRYLRGALRYSPSSGWEIKAASSTFWVITNVTETIVTLTLWDPPAQSYQYQAEALTAGEEYSFAHAGGPIGMKLAAAAATYPLIIPGNPAPQFQLISP